ncbi:MAG: hypothetical protein HYZ37_15670 [Candidatus Solibacter usitatus]|nr:hypothetical protein [Candidatus Solibacter usitatus]
MRSLGLVSLLFASARFAAAWPADLKASRTGEFTHAGKSYASSSIIRVQWVPPEAAVTSFRITAADRRSGVRAVAAPDSSAIDIELLKAGTEYRVSIQACLDAECTETLDGDESAVVTTELEHWRVQGAGRSYNTAARVVPDGNVGSYAMRYGPWAGPELDGRIQLYYNPMQREEKGIKIGELVAPKGDTIESASLFRGVSGFGLLRVCDQQPSAACAASRSLAMNLALFQAVPLAGENKVRLYFEAQGFDGRTRILYLDSQDGYLGRDFHPGTPTICAAIADYAPGGACEPALAIGVDIDGARGNANLLNARQFKIFYPAQDSWAWDQAVGTALWFTTEWPNGRCSSYGFNAAYAVWDGARWAVQYQENGCPKILAGAQAPMPVHIAGARYKVYFNKHPQPGGVTNPQTALKPMRMLYADPERSGDAALVEFEDWEPLEDARQIRYLWPDGTLLTDAEHSLLDDYMILAPGANPRELIMYSNMSASMQQPPFIGSAVLVNP